MQASDGSSVVSDATSGKIPSRSVLVYTVDHLPQGLQLAPLNPLMTLNADINPLNPEPEKCCDDYANWSDPHLFHPIILHCYRCNQNTETLRLKASISVPDDLFPEKRNHLAQSCPSSCMPPTKVRVLRRGRRPVIPGVETPILEVEVDGDLDALSDTNVRRYCFDLGCFDFDGGAMYWLEEVRAVNNNGRWNFRVWDTEEMKVMLGEVRGFRAKWVNVNWTEDSYDRLGLRVIDEHCSVKVDYPPQDWTSGEEDQGGQDDGGHGGQDDGEE